MSIDDDPINMNQASSISNLISQQLHSGLITPAQAAIMTSKLRMAESRMGGAGGQNSNISMGRNPINMNQVSSIRNLISQQLRSGLIIRAQAALMTSKLRMAESRMGGAGGQDSNIGALPGANRQVGSPSMGLPQQQMTNSPMELQGVNKSNL